MKETGKAYDWLLLNIPGKDSKQRQLTIGSWWAATANECEYSKIWPFLHHPNTRLTPPIHQDQASFWLEDELFLFTSGIRCHRDLYSI